MKSVILLYHTDIQCSYNTENIHRPHKTNTFCTYSHNFLNYGTCSVHGYTTGLVQSYTQFFITSYQELLATVYKTIIITALTYDGHFGETFTKRADNAALSGPVRLRLQVTSMLQSNSTSDSLLYLYLDV